MVGECVRRRRVRRRAEGEREGGAGGDGDRGEEACGAAGARHGPRPRCAPRCPYACIALLVHLTLARWLAHVCDEQQSSHPGIEVLT